MLQTTVNAQDSRDGHDERNSAASLAAARHDGKVHLLLASSGSVATIKLPEVVRALARHGNLSVRIILTEAAKHFLGGQAAEQPTVASLASLPNVDAVYDDAAEWGPEPWRRGAPILHIEARRWAHLLAVVPASADTLAKMANGFADSLLLSVVRAWDTDGVVDGAVPGVAGRRKRILVAPAMNTAMWRHPITKKHLRTLEDEWGVGREAADGDGDGAGEGWVEVLRPMQKSLACGDVGDGAMKDWREIVAVLEERLGLRPPP